MQLTPASSLRDYAWVAAVLSGVAAALESGVVDSLLKVRYEDLASGHIHGNHVFWVRDDDWSHFYPFSQDALDTPNKCVATIVSREAVYQRVSGFSGLFFSYFAWIGVGFAFLALELFAWSQRRSRSCCWRGLNRLGMRPSSLFPCHHLYVRPSVCICICRMMGHYEQGIDSDPKAPPSTGPASISVP